MNILPFEFNDSMINLIAEITEKITKLEVNKVFESDFHLRKQNRVYTVQSTTAIENNSLSTKNVTDIIDGKIVVGDKKEIKEIKNTYLAYEKIKNYDPYNIKSFLRAHGYITDSLLKSSGNFRMGDVGVLENNKVIHLGARPQFVYDLMKELFDWAKNSVSHPLIISSIVHFEIETIHPFEDGNGRIGRLWQTVILSKWKSIFEYIPIETIIYKHQEEYYKALEDSRNHLNSNDFILFMLNTINEVLETMIDIDITDIITDIITDKLSKIEKEVLIEVTRYLIHHKSITNQKVQELTGKGYESIKKYLNKFVKLNILIPIGENKGRNYELNKELLVKK